MNVDHEPRMQHWFRAWSQKQTPDFLPISLLLAGFLARFALAWFTFLNPDEILHYLLSDQPSLGLAYQASLTTAHPPLLILFLFYWRVLGHAEWILRFPSVLAGTAFCWVTFLWLSKVANRSTALTGLALLLFSPSLIHLSAEIRQYAFLLFFSAAALYLLECAFAEKSAGKMALSFVALDLALLTHYSALIFALSVAGYALVRLYRGTNARVAVPWIIGQFVALALCAFLYATHISRLKTSGPAARNRDLAGQLDLPFRSRSSRRFCLPNDDPLFPLSFHPRRHRGVGFRVFSDWRDRVIDWRPEVSSRPRQAKFAPAWAAAGAALRHQLQPGSGRALSVRRHQAQCGASSFRNVRNCDRVLPLDGTRWVGKTACFGSSFVLVVCNVFPTPTGAYIQPRNQGKKLMEESLQFVQQQIPPGSVVFTDNGGGLSLSYYFCHQRVVQYQLPFQPFLLSDCNGLHVITPAPNFKTLADRSALGSMDTFVRENPSAQIWFFQAGWIAGKEDIRRTMLQTGCHEPRKFGQNILLCQL